MVCVCDYCDGTGRITEDDYSEDETKQVERRCPGCLGSGQIREENKVYPRKLYEETEEEFQLRQRK